MENLLEGGKGWAAKLALHESSRHSLCSRLRQVPNRTHHTKKINLQFKMFWRLESCVARGPTQVPLLELRLGIQVSWLTTTTTTIIMVLIRNDMDTVGVRAGCTFTGFSGSAFNGNSVMVRAEQWDHWVVFSRYISAHLRYPFMWRCLFLLFASPLLIRANWLICLQRGSVSTHRRRHWITHLPLHTSNLRSRVDQAEFVTRANCLQINPRIVHSDPKLPVLYIL